MIEIDGSYGSGGGQVLRTAVALSAITEKPVKIFNIRAKRCNPGLRPQHLKGIEACGKLCNGRFKGLRIGSRIIEFFPGKIKGGNYDIDIGTAGSISLVLQTLVIPSLHAESEVVLNIKGGTDVRWAPTIEFFKSVFSGNLKKMGADIKSKILRVGYYPKGGGKVRVEISPCEKIKSINWVEQGGIKKIECCSFASEHLKGKKVAERQAEGFKETFKSAECKIKYFKTLSPGSSITAHAHCNAVMGASVLGERKKRAEEVGKACADLLRSQLDSGACLDRWMADQILPFLAIGSGKVSVAEITNHCLTNVWVIEKFLPVKFKIEGRLREKGIITVEKI